MKTNLFSLAFCLLLSASHAQTYTLCSHIIPDLVPAEITEPMPGINALGSEYSLTEKHYTRPEGANNLSIFTISQGANAYGMSGNFRRLWADNNIGSICFNHPMGQPHGSGFRALDFSTNGGWNWNSNIIIYDPNQAGGATTNFHGGIYNPAGNTNPVNGFFTFNTLRQSTNYSHGVYKLDQSSNPTFNSWSGYQSGVSAFTINPVSGHVITVGTQMAGNVYQDNLIVSRGVFNPAINDYEYSQSLIPLPAAPGAFPYPVNLQVAFAPDGQTGYISMLWDNHLDNFAMNAAFYPILLKTSDGGYTWSGPYAVSLGGPNGLEQVKYYLTDEQWETLWEPPYPHRDSVIYTTAYQHGLVVDAYNNVHIGVTIGVSGIYNGVPYSIIASSGYGATFHLISLPFQSYTYSSAIHLNTNKTFRGTFGFGGIEITEDNRSQASISQDGKKVFISWLDTDFEGFYTNIMPDIHCYGYNVMTAKHTGVFNVTYLSDAWLEAYMGTASHYVFSDGPNHVIPYVYQTITGGNILYPVEYKYIADFTINNSAFVNTPDNVVFLPGDVLGDGSVHVGDVVQMVNYLMGNNPAPFAFWNADLNKDGMITILDVVLLVEIILSQD